jgi:hypothetical protein
MTVDSDLLVDLGNRTARSGRNSIVWFAAQAGTVLATRLGQPLLLHKRPAKPIVCLVTIRVQSQSFSKEILSLMGFPILDRQLAFKKTDFPPFGLKTLGNL